MHHRKKVNLEARKKTDEYKSEVLKKIMGMITIVRDHRERHIEKLRTKEKFKSDAEELSVKTEIKRYDEIEAQKKNMLLMNRKQRRVFAKRNNVNKLEVPKYTYEQSDQLTQNIKQNPIKLQKEEKAKYLKKNY